MVERDNPPPTHVVMPAVHDNYVFGAHVVHVEVPIHHLQPPKQSGRERKPESSQKK